MKLRIASGNAHKISEIRQIFHDLPIEVSGFQDWPAPIEDGETFEENAVKKVEALPLVPNEIYLADDSGLEVDVLGGAPGIFSARYAEPGKECRKLLDELGSNSNRNAHFTCVIALAFPTGDIHTVRGEAHGTISTLICGEKGFGYDPIFIPNGHDRTFAEMTPQEKNNLSHRNIALQQARAYLLEFIRSHAVGA